MPPPTLAKKIMMMKTMPELVLTAAATALFGFESRGHMLLPARTSVVMSSMFHAPQSTFW
jgi:hypothetical protein